MEKHVLTKSTFIKGFQCHKALYLSKYHSDLREEISSQQEAVFSQGKRVGELAQQLFPGGVNGTPKDCFNMQEAINRTKKEIEKGTKVIYEAAFKFNGVLAVLDILVKDKNGWKAYEVKSSTAISETYELDATIQYYVINNSGINLKDISIVFINNQYVKNGHIDIKKLFSIESVKEQVSELLPSIPAEVAVLKKVLAKT